MGVRIMTWLPAAAGFLALSAVADDAAAQCNGGCPPPPPPCCEPPPPPPPPPPPVCCQPPPPPSCCGGGNLNVNVNVNAAANAGARANVGLNARTGGLTWGGGGGGSAYVTVDQPYPTTINGLMVEGARVRETVRVPYESRRRWEKRVVIQAVCIDDRAIPHPASQVRPDREVDGSYEGELYRCLAGASLQFTWAEYQGEVRFDHGETVSCRKGEALWYGGGAVECRTQRAERECNERSLLRRYGAGVKILTWMREETYTEYREEVVERSGMAVSGGAMTLDGGVGGRVF